MERAEAAAKGWGGADGAAEGVAGEGGADEAREVGQAEEDLSEEVVAESSDSGATGRPAAAERPWPATVANLGTAGVEEPSSGVGCAYDNLTRPKALMPISIVNFFSGTTD